MKDEKKIKSKVKEEYSDGPAEREILDLFQSKESETKIQEILKNSPSWPMRYHLSEERENLLSWYPFKTNGSLLEVGSGCGAITGLFCKKVKKVVAVELTKTRARITKERHKNYDNLEVISGNLGEAEINDKFDYVTSIGVLEYAGKYTESDNPFLDFTKKLKSYLKKNGILILALENRFGLKYWSGASEDHTGLLFDSLEGYPAQNGIKTFGKKELEELLKNAGFSNIEFYYPMPDYKLPTEIFSDHYLPTTIHNIRPGMLPVPDPSRERLYLFNERLVSDGIVRNDNFPFFANSFLIFARGDSDD